MLEIKYEIDNLLHLFDSAHEKLLESNNFNPTHLTLIWNRLHKLKDSINESTPIPIDAQNEIHGILIGIYKDCEELILHSNKITNDDYHDITIKIDELILYIAGIKQAFNIQKDIIEKQNAEIKQLKTIKDETYKVEEYANAEYDAKKRALFWHIIMTGAIVFMIAFILLYFINNDYTDYNVVDTSSTVDWMQILSKLLITKVLAFGIIYSARQAGKYNQTEKEYRDLSLKLSTVDSFISNIPDDLRGQVKADVARSVYCSDSTCGCKVDDIIALSKIFRLDDIQPKPIPPTEKK